MVSKNCEDDWTSEGMTRKEDSLIGLNTVSNRSKKFLRSRQLRGHEAKSVELLLSIISRWYFYTVKALLFPMCIGEGKNTAHSSVAFSRSKVVQNWLFRELWSRFFKLVDFYFFSNINSSRPFSPLHGIENFEFSIEGYSNRGLLMLLSFNRKGLVVLVFVPYVHGESPTINIRCTLTTKLVNWIVLTKMEVFYYSGHERWFECASGAPLPYLFLVELANIVWMSAQFCLLE